MNLKRLGVLRWIAVVAAFASANTASPQVPTAPEARRPWCSSTPEDLLGLIYDSAGRLRPVIPVRALSELSACGDRGPASPSAVARKAVKEAKYTSHRVPEGNVPYRYRSLNMFAECIVPGVPCEIDAYVAGDVVLSSYDKAKTGGLPFAWLLGHAGDEGHYEITQRAMLKAQDELNVEWPSTLIEVMANASGDADFYDWFTPAAHGQTRSSDETGLISQSQEEAHRQYRGWLDRYAGLAVASCRAGHASNTAYFLGYLLHGLQDVAFHEGITNAEHSFQDNINEAPVDQSDGKDYARKMDLAIKGTVRVIVGFFQYVRPRYPACWDALLKGPITGPDWFQKRVLLGKKNGMDLDLWEAISFGYLGNKVRDGMNSDTDPRYFINAPWLEGLKEEKMNETADGIVVRNFPR